MIRKIDGFMLTCDNCHESYIESYSNYCVWLEESFAIESAIDDDWIEHEGKHYCPSCYEIDNDDNVIIKERENTNE